MARARKTAVKSKAEILGPGEVAERPALTPETWLDDLSHQERVFLLEWLTDLNVVRAAKVADYSDEMARTACYSALSNPQYKPRFYAAVQFALEMRRRDLMVTADMVVRELAAIAFSDPRRAVRWRAHKITEQDELEPGDDQNPDRLVIREIVTNEVELVPSDQLDDATARAIKEIRQTADGVVIKFHDKGPALGLLARHTGLVGEFGDAARRMLGLPGQQLAHAGDAVNASAKQAAEGFRALMESE